MFFFASGFSFHWKPNQKKEETKKEKKETEPEEKKEKKETKKKKKEKRKKEKRKMAGPNGNGSKGSNESQESNGSQDTKRAPVQMGVAGVEYDIGAQVRESYSSWLLCRESADLGSPPYSTVS